MWGMIAKITLVPGKREEMIEILKERAAHMPGATPRGKAIVSNFERIAVTSPIWGAGLPAPHA